LERRRTLLVDHIATLRDAVAAPRSPLAARLSEILSPVARLREKMPI
jgi:hypothetical protein